MTLCHGIGNLTAIFFTQQVWTFDDPHGNDKDVTFRLPTLPLPQSLASK